MKNETYREGETIEFTLSDTDLLAQTAKLTISKAGAVALTESANYTTVDGKRVVTIRADNDLPKDVYDYMFTVTYSDGFIAKLPEISNCKGDCKLPTLTICDANDVEVA